MNNHIKALEEIYELIAQISGAPAAANRYVYAKKLREKIDELFKKLVSEANDLVTQELKKQNR